MFRRQKTEQSYPAGQPSLFVVRRHTKSMNKHLYGFVDAVLIIKTQASNVKCVCIRGIQSQDVTVKTDLLLWQCKSICARLLHETLATWMSLTLVRHQVWCVQTMRWPFTKSKATNMRFSIKVCDQSMLKKKKNSEELGSYPCYTGIYVGRQ